MRLPLVIGSVLLFTGCAAQESYIPQPQSTFSQASSYSAPSNDIPPSAPRAEGDKIVRPDRLVQSFALSVEDSPGLGFDVLRAAADDLEKRVKDEQKGNASLRLRGVRRQSHGGKMAGGGEYKLVLDGEVVTALPPEGAFWERGAAVITAQRLAHEVSEKGLGPEGKVHASFSAPAPSLADPEKHRADLVKKWTERVRGFTTAAERDGAPLAVVDCRPPGPVSQHAVSLEEVVLSIDMTCKLDSPKNR